MLGFYDSLIRQAHGIEVPAPLEAVALFHDRPDGPQEVSQMAFGQFRLQRLLLLGVPTTLDFLGQLVPLPEDGFSLIFHDEIVARTPKTV